MKATRKDTWRHVGKISRQTLTFQNSESSTESEDDFSSDSRNSCSISACQAEAQTQYRVKSGVLKEHT